MSTTKPTIEQAWVIKYKPEILKDLLAPKKVKARFADGILNTNVLFAGPPGTGKTSLANILCTNANSKFIDCSTDRGIDTIRNQILTFGLTTSLKSNKKIIVLDEVDGLTKTAQLALKASMDSIAETVNFIVTTNHPEKIIDALHSRYERVDFVFEADEKNDLQIQFLNRIKDILKIEGYKISNDAVKYLLENIFPDIRQTLIVLYKLSKIVEKGEIIDLSTIVGKLNVANLEFYEMLTTPKTEPEMYKFVKGTYDRQFKEAFDLLGEPFLEWMIKEKRQPELMLTVAAIVHKYQFESSMTSYNPMLGLLACCNTINGIFKSVNQ